MRLRLAAILPVLAAILERHLGVDNRRLAQIFPGLPPARSDLGELIAG